MKNFIPVLSSVINPFFKKKEKLNWQTHSDLDTGFISHAKLHSAS